MRDFCVGKYMSSYWADVLIYFHYSGFHEFTSCFFGAQVFLFCFGPLQLTVIIPSVFYASKAILGQIFVIVLVHHVLLLVMSCLSLVSLPVLQCLLFLFFCKKGLFVFCCPSLVSLYLGPHSHCRLMLNLCGFHITVLVGPQSDLDVVMSHEAQCVHCIWINTRQLWKTSDTHVISTTCELGPWSNWEKWIYGIKSLMLVNGKLCTITT